MSTPAATRRRSAPRPRGRGAEAERLRARPARARLLEAARELAAERGYEDLRVAELVGRAGVSRETFYTHFSGKRDCVAEACAPELAALASGLGDAAERGSAWARPLIEALEETLTDLYDSPASTRGRLIAAMLDTVAERGYPETRLIDVIRAARSSHPAFYKRFADKADCFAAAHASQLARLEMTLSASLPSRAGEHEFLRALGAALAAEPGRARVLLVEADRIPGSATHRPPRRAFAELLGRLIFGEGRPGPAPFAVGALLEALRAAALADQLQCLPERLPGLAPLIAGARTAP